MKRSKSVFLAALLGLGLLGSACGGSNGSGPGGDASAGGGDGPGRGDVAGGQDGLTLPGGSGGVSGTGAGGSGTPGGNGGTSGTGTDAATTPVPISCPVAAPQCNDGIDNDNDGKVDSLDAECVGPCDNDEGSFATGISGDNIDACKQDCFFDGNSGMGDDGCDWNFKCDSANPGGTSCPYDANYKNCPKEQSAKCVRNCQKLTPNGCDCFGCCAVTVNGQPANVMLTATCTAAKFGDPVACPRCTQNTACLNTCDKCEVCIGRPAPDPSCNVVPGTPDGGVGTDGGGSTPLPDAGTPVPGQCPAGVTSCGPGGQVSATGCGSAAYCQTGCCVSFVVD
jgi:hypothetical protein